MPEQRLQRTRATLPSAYQFGDARTSDLEYCAGSWHWFPIGDLGPCQCGNWPRGGYNALLGLTLDAAYRANTLGAGAGEVEWR